MLLVDISAEFNHRRYWIILHKMQQSKQCFARVLTDISIGRVAGTAVTRRSMLHCYNTFFLSDCWTLGPEFFSRPLPSYWYWKRNFCIKLKWNHKNTYARPSTIYVDDFTRSITQFSVSFYSGLRNEDYYNVYWDNRRITREGNFEMMPEQLSDWLCNGHVSSAFHISAAATETNLATMIVGGRA